MARVLLVEDDPILGKGLKVKLELESYTVDWAKNLKEAIEKSAPRVHDLLILDLGLPDGSGLDLLKKLRAGGSLQPVIILTAQTDDDSVVAGLESGANDYVKKPFSQRELVARIRACLRKVEAGKDSELLQFASLTVDLKTRKVFSGEKAFDLNRREFDILCHFIRRADGIVSRENLLETIDKDGEIFDRTVDSHVSHLRQKLKSNGVTDVVISSVYGVGYRLERAGEN